MDIEQLIIHYWQKYCIWNNCIYNEFKILMNWLTSEEFSTGVNKLIECIGNDFLCRVQL